MGNGRIPSDDDDEVTDPSIRTPELLDEMPPSSARPPPLPSARVARELPPLRPPLSARPPALPLGRPTTPSGPPPPPGALLRPPPSALRPPSMPPPRPPAATTPAVARSAPVPPPRLPSIPPPRPPSPLPSPQLPSAQAPPRLPPSPQLPSAQAPPRLPSPPQLPSAQAPPRLPSPPQLPSAQAPPRASSPPVPSTPPLRAAASAPPRLNDALSYTARRPSDPPPIAAAFDVGRLAQLQRELDEAQSRASKLLAELSGLRPAMLELEAARKRITELEARVAELSTSKPRDDLRRIKGIGPKFEQALRDAGVCSFAQIASWTDVDIAEIAAKIGARVDRIERDEWVDKARALVAGP